MRWRRTGSRRTCASGWWTRANRPWCAAPQPVFAVPSNGTQVSTNGTSQTFCPPAWPRRPHACRSNSCSRRRSCRTGSNGRNTTAPRCRPARARSCRSVAAVPSDSCVHRCITVRGNVVSDRRVAGQRAGRVDRALFAHSRGNRSGTPDRTFPAPACSRATLRNRGRQKRRSPSRASTTSADRVGPALGAAVGILPAQPAVAPEAFRTRFRPRVGALEPAVEDVGLVAGELQARRAASPAAARGDRESTAAWMPWRL